MTNPTHSEKRPFIQKGDLILLVLLLCLSGILLFITRGPQHTGTIVSVTIDGENYGSWPLSNDQDINIVSDYGSNCLQICNGTASVLSADCPDLICVHHTPISHAGERIVCLPNRVVIAVEATTDSASPDAISQ